MKEKVIVRFKLCWTIIVWKNGIFFSMRDCNNKVIIMQLKELISNCGAATYISILCAKYYKNWSMFVKKTYSEIKKGEQFWGTRCTHWCPYKDSLL